MSGDGFIETLKEESRRIHWDLEMGCCEIEDGSIMWVNADSRIKAIRRLTGRAATRNVLDLGTDKDARG